MPRKFLLPAMPATGKVEGLSPEEQSLVFDRILYHIEELASESCEGAITPDALAQACRDSSLQQGVRLQ